MHEARVTRADLNPHDFRADFEVVLEIWEGVHKVQRLWKRELASGALVRLIALTSDVPSNTADLSSITLTFYKCMS